MRIISGRYRKKIINPPSNFHARPTTDIAKEALFNILVNTMDIEKVEALDLFSGSGSIAYELASRGCKEVWAIELNYNHFAFIKKTAEELKFDQMKVIKADVFKFLEQCHRKFDLIFADPPYELEKQVEIPSLVFKNELLTQDGVLIVEHSEETDYSEEERFIETRKYGKVHFSFFK